MNTKHCPLSEKGCQRKVLIVENDPKQLLERIKTLRNMGYTPVVADGEGESLMANAVQIAMTEHCPVALVDVRLMDDQDVNDKSGLELIPRLKPTKTIIVTSYPVLSDATRISRKGGAHGTWGKEEGPAELRPIIESAFTEFCQCHVPVDWGAWKRESILHELNLEPTDRNLHELSTVVAQVFREEDVQRINLVSPADRYKTNPSPLPLARSVVFFMKPQGIDENWHREQVVKISVSERTKQEQTNYNQFIKHFMEPPRCARIENDNNVAALWNLGAVVYTNVAGRDQKALRQGYSDLGRDQIVRAIQDLFRETLKWKDVSDGNTSWHHVYDYYTETFSKLGRKLEDPNNELGIVWYLGLRDPVAFAKNNRSKSRFLTRWKKYTHGDLHSQNVFVNTISCQTSVIDFERSGPGYYMRDHVELEADIRLRLLHLEREEFLTAFQMDLELLRPRYSDEVPTWNWKGLPRELQKNEKVRKAFEAIAAIRDSARIKGLEEMREYYWALLMETLISVVRDYSRYDDPAASLAKDRAVLSAALIAERLARWDDPWPPKEWRDR